MKKKDKTLLHPALYRAEEILQECRRANLDDESVPWMRDGRMKILKDVIDGLRKAAAKYSGFLSESTKITERKPLGKSIRKVSRRVS